MGKIMNIKPKILIVDDHVENLIALERILEDIDVDFIRAKSGKEAVFKAIEEDFALILMDVQMPEMDGFEALTFIRKEKKNINIPVIFISAIFREEIYKIKGIRTGAIDFITKPFSDEVMVGKVSLLLKLYNQRVKIQNQVTALEEAQQYLQNLIDSLPSMLVCTDTFGIIKFLNCATTKTIRLKASEVIGQSFQNLFSFLPVNYEEVLSTLKKGQIYIKNRIEVTLHDKEKIFDFTAFTMDNLQISQIVIRIDDVTDKVNTEEKLRQSEKLEVIGRLTGGVVHDFNNQISCIVGATELLKDEFSENSSQGKFCSLILKASSNATDLSSKLLAFSRKGRMNSKVINVETIIKEAISLLTRTIDKQISINTELSAINDKVLADSAQFQNAVLNLGINARDAMPNGGSITFSTLNLKLDETFCKNSSFELDPGEYFQLTVKDTGQGMDEKTIKRIFEPFFTTKKTGKGTGLGLSSLYKMTTELHGAIVVNSTVGKGSEFNLYFKSQDEFSHDFEHTMNHVVKGQGTILVIEDEELIRDVITKTLKKLGYQVLLAKNGDEGIKIFQQHSTKINLVILDMIMPKMNGNQCLAAIRKISPNIKIIIASGNIVDVENFDWRYDKNIYFINKPFRKAELSQVLAEALNKKTRLVI